MLAIRCCGLIFIICWHARHVTPDLCPLHGRQVSATMAWLLLHDVAAPTPAHDHPLQVMATTAFHGGMWRCAYKQESMGAYAYIAGKLGYSVAL